MSVAAAPAQVAYEPSAQTYPPSSMPARTPADDAEAVRISREIDEDLKVSTHYFLA